MDTGWRAYLCREFDRMAGERCRQGRQRSSIPGLWQRGLKRAGTPVLHFLRDRLAVLSHRANSIYVFNVDAQDFAYAPGLRHASSRTVGRVAIEDLRDLSQRGIGEKMILQRQEPFARLSASGVAGSVHFHIRGDERPDQPRPYRALVVCAIAFDGSPAV